MAEAAIGALLSVPLTKLLELVGSLGVELGTKGLKLKTLEVKLKEVKEYLDDAEDRLLEDKRLKAWLDDFKHVVFMADDLVEKINNSKEAKRFERWILDVKDDLVQSLNGFDRFGVCFEPILKELESVLNRPTALEPKSSGSRADLNRRLSLVSPWREESQVYGRTGEKEEILKMVLSEEDQMMVIPIVGMGGLGKTTLAKLVYNDERVEEHGFSLKAWVTVSPKFDFCRIMKELLQEVNPGTSCSNVNDKNNLQRLMKEALRGKKFLLVLDDVWDKNYNSWDPLKSILTAGDPKSRVIVTTRNRAVGSMVKTGPMLELKEIQNDDCWSIFVDHAFNGDMEAAPELQAIGRRIVDKCKGLPTAIIYLGGRLRSERSFQVWEDTLCSNWTEAMETAVLPSLWLSYRDLSSTLKQCFAYCCLFPKDHEFKKKEIVLLWMAEGFIQEGRKSMEKLGEEYFDDLVSRSLFQRSSEGDDKYVVHHLLSGSSENESAFVMHDLVHDLAALVYGNFCFSICKDNDLKNVTVRTRHLMYNTDVSSHDMLASLNTAKHLRTFLSSFNAWAPGDDFVKKIVQKVPCLRVLTLSLKVQKLHRSLGELKMLRYLNLTGSEIEELPISICSLFHLQTLILRYCHKITQLPTDLPRKLSKLRYLDTYCRGLTKMPPKMGSLKELRTLANFVLGKDDGRVCSTLQELGELHHLGALLISDLENVEKAEDVKKANLEDKPQMEELLLSWGGIVQNAEDVLCALQPHKNLKKLVVHNYPGSRLPGWVGDKSFSKMTSVRLNGTFSHLCQLPPLGQLPSLRELRIERFKGVNRIGNELLYGNDANSSVTPFPRLETLSFFHMESWNEWSFFGNESGSFPRLKQLQLKGCPKLESIIREDNRPQTESTQLDLRWASLCKLTIVECPLLERRYQEFKGEHWHYISHIPGIHITGSTTIAELSVELEPEPKPEEEETRLGEENSESQIYFTIKYIAISVIHAFILHVFLKLFG